MEKRITDMNNMAGNWKDSKVGVVSVLVVCKIKRGSRITEEEDCLWKKRNPAIISLDLHSHYTLIAVILF